MKYIYRVLFITIVALTAFLGSCKKQARCGCDGDVINYFEALPAVIIFSEEDKSAEFKNELAPYSRYYFCNPTAMMPQLTKFKSGDRVLITCNIYWECNYMMQASNSPYGSIYRAYMADVVKIESSIYGND